ncbi:hypothetical protein C0Q70_16365 [Pomacea canaliculata]|uniref:Reelin domain-containing protein n=1 Tax=Pomacea canaliculata TaxID=400727 RepID=A0A2T7NPM7_POMCA|nr:hypothetical protein C0Q70_16365 [Pomacea canaliculata]
MTLDLRRAFQMQTLVVLLTAVLLSCCGPSLGYSTGPPVSACESMFPYGHEVDAQSSSPPYELVVTDTNLTASTQYSGR